MTIALNDASVQAAIISSSSTIITGILAACSAIFIGIRFDDRQKLKERLEMSMDDIAFLLAVEQEHCKRNVAADGTSHKVVVRDLVREQGLQWSGKFTRGRVEYSRMRRQKHESRTLWGALKTLQMFGGRH